MSALYQTKTRSWIFIVLAPSKNNLHVDNLPHSKRYTVSITLPMQSPYQVTCNQSNTTSATSGAGTDYPSGASEFTLLFLVWFSSPSVFSVLCSGLSTIICCMFCSYPFGHYIACPPQIYGCDNPFGIFKHYLINRHDFYLLSLN